MKKTTPPKEKRSPLHRIHRTSASRTNAAKSKASLAAAQDSRIVAINELDTTADQLQAYALRTPIYTVTPA